MGVLFDDPALGIALRNEYLRLTTPALGYRVLRHKNGELRWLDVAASPLLLLGEEPDTSVWRRSLVHFFGWLPIESQL